MNAADIDASATRKNAKTQKKARHRCRAFLFLDILRLLARAEARAGNPG
jgi:hypothetical protein